MNPDPDVTPLRALIESLMRIDPANRHIAEMLSGVSVRYELGAAGCHRLPALRLAIDAVDLVWLPNRRLGGYARIPVAWSTAR